MDTIVVSIFSPNSEIARLYQKKTNTLPVNLKQKASIYRLLLISNNETNNFEMKAIYKTAGYFFWLKFVVILEVILLSS